MSDAEIGNWEVISGSSTYNPAGRRPTRETLTIEALDNPARPGRLKITSHREFDGGRPSIDLVTEKIDDGQYHHLLS
jgi:hypothetical protein